MHIIYASAYRKILNHTEAKYWDIQSRYSWKHLEGIGVNNYRGIGENNEDNNTSFNNTINNHHKVYSVGIPNDNQMDTQVRLVKVS